MPAGPLSGADDPGRDLELVRAALRGSGRDRELLARRMACVPRMIACRNARMGRPLGPDEVADLAQDAVLAAWRRLDSFAGSSTLETWLYGFSVNVVMAALRRRQRRPHAQDLSAEIPEAGRGALPLEFEGLHAALQQLPEAEALVLHSKHFLGQTFEEMAVRLAISPNTAKTRYYRGLRRLARKLGTPGETGR